MLTIAPASVNFGGVGTYTTATGTFKITNSGLGTLSGNVSTTGVGDPFSLLSGSGAFVLGPGQTKIVSVKFAPRTPRSFSESILITSSDPSNPARFEGLAGVGKPAGLKLVPVALYFGKVSAGQTKTMNLEVENTGLGVMAGSVDVSKLKTPFQALSGTGAFFLSHGQQKTVSVKFAPTAKSPFAGTIGVTSNDPAHGSVSVVVRGTGD